MLNFQNKKIELLIFVILIFVWGCTVEQNFLRAALLRDSYDGTRDAESRQKVDELLRGYIGKDSATLLRDLGQPTEIKKNIYRGGKLYDEEWYFYNSRGIPLVNQNSWAYVFYFNRGIIEDVLFL